MAGRARLNAGARLGLLALLVLVVHALTLQWLARQLDPPSALRLLATPMFTRLLQPEAPPAVRAQPAAAPTRARRPAITRVAKAPANPAPAAPASAPAVPASHPSPDAPAAAPAPEVTESTPEGSATVAPSVVADAAPAAPASATASADAKPAHAPGLDSWPADTRLSYRLSGNYRGELYGNAQVQWQREGDRYQTRIEIDLTFLASLVLTSQGQVTAQGLAPQVYEELRRSRPRGVRLGEDSITLNDGRKLPRPAGVQDTASQFVELGHRFATGRQTLEAGQSVSFWMARPGAVDLWTYDIVGQETLQTPELGPIEAFHMKPRPIANPRGNITAEMWFAPSLHFLPVRIRVSMGEEAHVDLIVLKIEQR